MSRRFLSLSLLLVLLSPPSALWSDIGEGTRAAPAAFGSTAAPFSQLALAWEANSGAGRADTSGEVTSAISGEDLALSWSHQDSAVEHYEVYTNSQDPYFEVDDASILQVCEIPAPDLGSMVACTHEGVVGSSPTQYFYQVWAILMGGGSYRLQDLEGVFMYGLAMGNRPPVANDDEYLTYEGVPLAVPTPGVLKNDSDADGNSLTALLIDNPANGTVEFHGDGSFSYSPAGGFTGTDSFTYEASDGSLVSGAGVVTIDVQPAISLNLTPSTLRVKTASGSLQLLLSLDQNGTLTDVTQAPTTTYASSEPGVMSVDSFGLLTFVSTGAATITASYGGLSDDCAVEVNPAALELVTGQVGPSGGSVGLPNGTGVKISSGALPIFEDISIVEGTLPANAILPPDTVVSGPTYDFLPAGRTFGQPVQISIAYDPTMIPAGYDEKTMLSYVIDESGNFELDRPTEMEFNDESVPQAVDTAKKLVTAASDHFSARTPVSSTDIYKNKITLTAPDLTTLDVYQVQKPMRLASVEKNDPPEVQKKICKPPHDLLIDDRAQQVDYIILHSTSAGPKALGKSFEQEVAGAKGSWCTWAQYYVSKDGRIVKVNTDNKDAHHAGDAIDPDTNLIITNDIAIGIRFTTTAARSQEDAFLMTTRILRPRCAPSRV